MRRVLHVDGALVKLEWRWQTVVVVDHVNGRLLVLQLQEGLNRLVLQNQDVGDQTKSGSQFDDLSRKKGRKHRRRNELEEK